MKLTDKLKAIGLAGLITITGCVYPIPEKKPDLVVENPYFSKIEGRKVTLLFRIRNIGDAVADPVYWMVDTDSADENPERTSPVSLEPGKMTLGGFQWDYSQPGNYNPKVIVDHDNLIDEYDESNNKASVPVSVQ